LIQRATDPSTISPPDPTENTLHTSQPASAPQASESVNEIALPAMNHHLESQLD